MLNKRLLKEGYIRNVADNFFVERGYIRSVLEDYTIEELGYFKDFLLENLHCEIITLDESKVGQSIERYGTNKTLISLEDMQNRFEEYRKGNHVSPRAPENYDKFNNIAWAIIFGVGALDKLLLPKAVAMGVVLAPPAAIAGAATVAAIAAVFAIYNVLRVIYKVIKGTARNRNKKCMKTITKVIKKIEKVKLKRENTLVPERVNTSEITTNVPVEREVRPLNRDFINGRTNTGSMQRGMGR